MVNPRYGKCLFIFCNSFSSRVFQYTRACDVFSFAGKSLLYLLHPFFPAANHPLPVTLSELFTHIGPYGRSLAPPFNAVLYKHQIDRGQRPIMPADVPDHMCALLDECWDADPARRPEFDVILERLKRGPVKKGI